MGTKGEHLLGVEPIDLQWHAPGEAGACKVVFRNGEGLGHWGWDSGLERGCFLVMLHDTKMLSCSVPILSTFDTASLIGTVSNLGCSTYRYILQYLRPGYT